MIKHHNYLFLLLLLATIGCNSDNPTTTSGEDPPQTGLPLPPVNPTPHPIASIPQGSDLNILTRRIQAYATARESDIAARRGYSLEALANQYHTSINTDGKWADLNYNSTLDISQHLARVKTLAAAYNESQNPIYSEQAIKALSYWAKQKTQHWQAEQPMIAVILLGETLPPDLKTDFEQFLSLTAHASTLNKPEERALAMTYHGLITNDIAGFTQGLKELESGVKVTSFKGIQYDNSYHKQNFQLQFGEEEESHLKTVLTWAYWVHDLDWKFSEEIIKTLTDFYLDGIRWMTRGSDLDFNVRGSAVSREEPEDLLTRVEKVLSYMDMVATLSPMRAAEAMTFEQHSTGGPSGLNGFRHYWNSDYSVKVTDNYSFGIRMNSRTTKATDSSDGENLRGYWLGFGSTSLRQSGDEYLNIYPVWDWSLIPGVTAPAYLGRPDEQGKIEQPAITFVGAATDNTYGVTAMDMNITTKPEHKITFSTKARKSWFSFEDEIVALGSSITSSHDSGVSTTLNQTLLKGKVTVDGYVLNSENSGQTINGLNWAHHNNTGYIFPENGNYLLTTRSQSGSWNSINTRQSKKPVTKNVFTLRIMHGIQPDNDTYQYIIAPGITAEQTQNYYQSMPVEVLENSTGIQAVRHKELNITGIVFYRMGKLDLDSDLSISVNSPCILILNNSGSELEITVSTPGKSFGEVSVTLASKVQGKSVTQKVITPGYELSGKSVSFPFYQGQNDPALTRQFRLYKQGGSELLVTKDSYVENGASSGKNFGSADYLTLKNGDNGYGRKGIISFDISSLKGLKLRTATLNLYLKNIVTKSSHSSGIIATMAKSSDWQEKSISWDTMPDTTAMPKTGPLPLTNSGLELWHSIDITELLKHASDQDTITLLLNVADPTDKTSYLSVASREFKNGKYAPRIKFLEKE